MVDKLRDGEAERDAASERDALGDALAEMLKEASIEEVPEAGALKLVVWFELRDADTDWVPDMLMLIEALLLKENKVLSDREPRGVVEKARLAEPEPEGGLLTEAERDTDGEGDTVRTDDAVSDAKLCVAAAESEGLRLTLTDALMLGDPDGEAVTEGLPLASRVPLPHCDGLSVDERLTAAVLDADTDADVDLLTLAQCDTERDGAREKVTFADAERDGKSDTDADTEL